VLKTLSGAGCDVAMHGLGDQAALQKVLQEVSDSTGARTLHSGADLRRPAEIRDMVRQVRMRAAGLCVLTAHVHCCCCNEAGRGRAGQSGSGAVPGVCLASAGAGQVLLHAWLRPGAAAAAAAAAAPAGQPACPPCNPAPQVADYFGRIDILVNNVGGSAAACL
jgi:hypothetical protein